MTGKAKSLAQKTREAREAHDLLMARAIALYQQEQQKPVHEKRKGLRTILNHNTLRNLANGGRSKADFNATKAWLTQAEEKNIVGIVKEYGEWGFPVTHRRLKELVDEVCRTRLGDKFLGPPLGIKTGWCSQSYFK
ncbi:hypothetical protein ARMSODRAFT_956698 [Armillaria solidipes]|uniref:HTH CENPB-type domain-containing protein n=1 Tax=Armillaria solidipes TaxID=1076256 RepID=A0A2H3BSD8_9AGAR|nr:hypothetical protein ARMSODRAFT_956698 [Armillaria solidipes]